MSQNNPEDNSYDDEGEGRQKRIVARINPRTGDRYLLIENCDVLSDPDATAAIAFYDGTNTPGNNLPKEDPNKR